MSPKDRLALFSVSRTMARVSVRQVIASYGRPLPAAIGAEDLESHALLALWDACECYEPARGSFRPYAQKAIGRRLRRTLSMHSRDFNVESLEAAEEKRGELLVSRDADLWIQVAAKIDREVVYRELSRLPKRTERATILSLRGFGPTEIGRELGISRQRANQLPREAVVQIRKQIGATNPE